MLRAIIVGAGPAGAAAAMRLATSKQVECLLLEQKTLPRTKACGSGLSPWTLKYLDLLGVGAQALQVLDSLLDLTPLLHERRRGGGLVPETRHLHLPVDVLQLIFDPGFLKDTPGSSTAARPGARASVAGR